MPGWFVTCNLKAPSRSQSIGRRWLLAAALAASVTTDCKKRSGGSGDPGSTAGRTLAPGFSLVESNGSTVRLSDYRGKVVLLNFWATWCGPCRVEIPWFIEFEKGYHDRGFAIIGISMDEQGWPVIMPYIKREGVNYRVVLGNDVVV